MNDRSRQDDVRRIRQLLESSGSASEEDLTLGRLALERNLLSSDQLAEAAGELQQARSRGEAPSLGKILLERGMLGADELLRLAADQARLSAQAPTLSRFEIRGCLGEGASAVVYRAWDRELKRLVALKVLRLTTGMSAVARSRFKREATAAAGLVHPNVVAVYDAAEEDGRPYLVMELIEGRTLHSLLSEAKTPKKTLVGYLEQAARGVAAAHEKGVVHRDLKPANILLTEAGDAKVADFGLAHLMDSDSLLTRSGAELGTPYYMSPEQVDGRSRESTPATDVYALGAILYEVLAGKPPHARPGIQETFAAILSQDPTPLRSNNPKIHADLETICLKALEKDPKRRYPSGREFADDLRAYLTGEFIDAVPVPRWRRRLRRALMNRALVAAVAIILLVSGGAAAVLVNQSLASRRSLDAEREKARRREAALQKLGTLQATILERGRELRLLRVPAEQARRDLDAALRDVDGFLRDWPESPQALYVRARGRILLGDLDGAERDLRTAVAGEPEFRPGWSLLGLLKLGEYQSKLEGPARTFDERMRALAPVLDQATGHFSRGWTSGREQEESARWGLAWTREDHVMERLARAFQLYYHDKKPDAARALLEEGDRAYQAEEYPLWLGLLFTKGTDRLPWVQKSIDRAPGYPLAYYYRGICRHLAGDLKGALADFDRVLSTESGSAWAYERRGEAKLDLGDLGGADADLTRALEIKPAYQEALVHRAVTRATQGKLKEALDDLDRAVSVDPNSPQALANRGNVKQLLEDLPGALADFDRALAIEKNRPDVWRNRAVAHMKAGDRKSARADLDRAIALNKSYLNAWDLRGMVREESGDLAGAIADYQEWLRLAPKDAPRRPVIEGYLKRARGNLKEE